MLLRIVRARLQSSVHFIWLCSGHHMNGIFDWADSEADGAASAVLLNNDGEVVVTFKFNGLVS